MKNFIFFGILMTFSGSASAALETLPRSWYELPEHQNSLLTTTELQDDENDPKLDAVGNQLDAIFASQATALEQTPGTEGSLLQAAQGDRVPWRFVSYTSDLGVSLKGLIGLRTWKGTSAVSVQWMKKEKQQNQQVAEQAGDFSAVFAANTETTKASLDAEIESAIHAILASHKITNESALRKNFREAAEDFVDLGARVQDATAPRVSWESSRIRVDLSVEASGKVSFAPTAGASLRVRLDWFRIPGKKPAIARLQQNKWFRLKGLESLLTALSRDIGTEIDAKGVGAAFVAKSFRVGLGASLAGTVGLAQGTAKALVHLYFTKTTSAFSSLEPALDDEPLYMIGSAPSPETLEFARLNGILVQLSPASGTNAEEALYKLNRNKFRKGIRRAMFIGRFLGRKADKHTTRAWKIKKLKTSFDVSVSGSVGLATLSGLASAEIEFENKNF